MAHLIVHMDNTVSLQVVGNSLATKRIKHKHELGQELYSLYHVAIPEPGLGNNYLKGKSKPDRQTPWFITTVILHGVTSCFSPQPLPLWPSQGSMMAIPEGKEK